MLMWKQCRLLTLERLQEVDDRFRRMKLSARGRGGDQKTEDIIDARNRCLASRADIAVDNVIRIGEVREQNAPSSLQNDRQRHAMLARDGFEFGGELGGELLFEMGL